MLHHIQGLSIQGSCIDHVFDHTHAIRMFVQIIQFHT